jgi:hypothetical protein
MNTARKPCLTCFEPIDARAKKCPHCHQLQVRAAVAMQSPWFLTLLFVVLFGFIGYLFWSLLQDLHREAFSSQLSVGSSTLQVSKAEVGAVASCFADITNKDQAVWKRPSLQAEFFDQSGALIDVHYAQDDFEIYPSFTAKGRVAGRANAGADQYASCKISVLSARGSVH